MTLEKISGLSDADPIFAWLKQVDKILDEMHIESWHEVHRSQSIDTLISGLLNIDINHRIDQMKVKNYIEWLKEQGELVLSELMARLLHYNIAAQNSFYFYTIKLTILTMMFIIINLQILKSKETRKYRSIDDAWCAYDLDENLRELL